MTVLIDCCQSGSYIHPIHRSFSADDQFSTRVPSPQTLSQQSNLGGTCVTPTHQLLKQSVVASMSRTHNVDKAHDDIATADHDELIVYGMHAVRCRNW